MSRPVGPPAPSASATVPSRESLHGRYTSLVPLQVSHAKPLWEHLGGEENADIWTYMFPEPFLEYDEFEESVKQWVASKDPLHFTVLSAPASDATAEPVGFVTLMNIVPDHRRVEIGCVTFGKKLQRTRQATETFYLLMKHAFDSLGYLRVEWKANNLNKPSLAAAQRLGFTFEGVFRKHMILKGRHRDTAWFSIVDDEWPLARDGLEAWLDEKNFDEQGQQRSGLKQLREGLEVKRA
ncbi:Uncharacterized protein C8035_v002916 [Colletotrichum spinosum]|uniref:N-acetyltransferase domain-containing protein n=1 Tax=Colletotrichum spinosum TaxID=1347390 RepID=A0A4R8PWZ1_9PEZI|nr:Uncharacterized protein C8035_v002916 [Colletotrichum spinosum]